MNLSQLPSASTPLHIVLWRGVETSNPTVTSYSNTEDTIKLLRDRISALEAMVTGLLETQKASQWFPSGLRPTPTGIDVVSRRESMGSESDMGAVLSQLVRPDTQTRSVKIVSVPVSADAPASGPEDAEAELDADLEAVEQEVMDDEQEGDAELEAVPQDAMDEQQDGEATEEVVEYKPIEWKGKTYYVDGNQEVYEMDSDGDLIETPIGQWREATQKLVRYKSA